jgi:hypothetical protein
MRKCPVCGRMTLEYDYSRGEWMCVCYECSPGAREVSDQVEQQGHAVLDAHPAVDARAPHQL